MRFDFPVPSPRVSSPFGPRVIQGVSGFHYGVDFGAVEGTPVFASEDGTVIESYFSGQNGVAGSYGNRIVISHEEGFLTGYAHLDVRIAEKGQTVKRGDVIGTVGNTGYSFGAHLHFEIKKGGAFIDPMLYLSSGFFDAGPALIVGALALAFGLTAILLARF